MDNCELQLLMELKVKEGSAVFVQHSCQKRCQHCAFVQTRNTLHFMSQISLISNLVEETHNTTWQTLCHDWLGLVNKTAWLELQKTSWIVQIIT